MTSASSLGGVAQAGAGPDNGPAHEFFVPAPHEPAGSAPAPAFGPVILEAEGLVRRFFGVTVLDGVSLSLAAGEVRALLGENGAGKSTMINLLSGVHQPDGGQLRLDGSPVRFARPLDADHAGISVIRQELSLFPDLSVAEAIFAGHLPLNRFGLVDWPRMRRAASAALSQLAPDIDINAPVASLSIARQQMVEIARALTRKARVVIMDEPTASLSPNEVAHLGRIIADLSREGVAVLYVSHRLDEIRAFCQTYTVLRDGKAVAGGRVADTDIPALIRAMAGREIAAAQKAPPAPVADQGTGEPLLQIRHLASPQGLRGGQRVKDVSFALRQGEILGLAGIVGAGRTETARMIFGLDPVGQGEIRLFGQPVRFASPAAAIAAGIGYVPEDRKGLSLLPGRSVHENFALTGAVPARFGRNDRRAEARLLAGFWQKLGIRAASPGAAITTLSGGNQQKVILARWIALKPKLLIIDEPTRGIDVGAKEDVHALIREIAASGVAVLLISSDLPEVMSLSHRIITLREGVTSSDQPAAGITAEALMTHMTRHA
ncbi:sugar ABC transporter ATP-binding protein [Xinfangfangia sp. D13-10-4-6]|uniref:sugar ABC transporter ATP-binding protein n=1 Tax=Pseudogemmobacter hezensis TaxID=2737662 RepID=UPI0015573AAE|nr:sugar ABC transporter ATP-binding protein [Pseudogemmobacter hezensis]NPD16839.1 sugar ABC transporter ATP-binding protein [Pseudogemmobacter hezensis]